MENTASMVDCSLCSPAINAGLFNWIRHLVESHTLPTEWPSQRAANLTGTDALKPYTVITESKKKRRKGTPPRPLNSYMVFAQHIRRNILRVFAQADNTEISIQLGALWPTVSAPLRAQFAAESKRMADLHESEFPDYKYRPKKRHVSIPQSISTNQINSSALNRHPGVHSSNCSVIHTVDRRNEAHSSSETRPNHVMTKSHPKVSSSSTNIRQVAMELEGERDKIDAGMSCQRFRCHKRAITASTCCNEFQDQYRSKFRHNEIAAPIAYTSHALNSELPSAFIVPRSSLYTAASCSEAGQHFDSAYGSGKTSSSASPPIYQSSTPLLDTRIENDDDDDVKFTEMNEEEETKGTEHKHRLMPIHIRRRVPIIPSRPKSQHPPCLPTDINPTRQRFFSATNGGGLPCVVTKLAYPTLTSVVSKSHSITQPTVSSMLATVFHRNCQAVGSNILDLTANQTTPVMQHQVVSCQSQQISTVEQLTSSCAGACSDKTLPTTNRSTIFTTNPPMSVDYAPGLAVGDFDTIKDYGEMDGSLDTLMNSIDIASIFPKVFASQRSNDANLVISPKANLLSNMPFICQPQHKNEIEGLPVTAGLSYIFQYPTIANVHGSEKNVCPSHFSAHNEALQHDSHRAEIVCLRPSAAQLSRLPNSTCQPTTQLSNDLMRQSKLVKPLSFLSPRADQPARA